MLTNKPFNSLPIFLLSLWFSFILLLIGSIPIFASDSANTIKDSVLIDSVVIINQNIYDLSLPENNVWLMKLANKLHVRSRTHIIRRELLLKEGDQYSEELAAESERNLRALPYFWDAEIILTRGANGKNIMTVTTSDKWTLAGGITFHRDAGQMIYQFGFKELNFFGYGQRISFDYYMREFEENYPRFHIMEPRFFGSRLEVGFSYDGDPEVGSSYYYLSKPLYSIDSKFGYLISVTSIDRTDKYYLSGREAGRNRYQGNHFKLSSVYRFGTYSNKVSIGLSYDYRDIQVSDRMIDPRVTIDFPTDSLYHGYSLELKAEDFRFIKTKQIDGILRVEDIRLGTEIGIASGWYFDIPGGNRIFRKVIFFGNYANQMGDNLFFLSISRIFWYEGGIDYRKWSNISIRYYNNRYHWITPVASLVYIEDSRLDGNKLLYLGENTGIRGFPRYYTEGEKLLRLNFENRFFPGIKILSNGIGLVQFVDLGQTWSNISRHDFGDYLWSVGVGLRFGAERVSSAGIIRIDLAYAGNIKNWQISIGIGQYIL